MIEVPANGVQRTMRRILAVFDACTDVNADIEEVVRYAARLDAELLSLFVEDINLFRLAELPFAREIIAASRHPRPLDPFSLERSLKQRAERLQKLIETSALRAHIPCSFETIRGHLLSELMSRSPQADMVFLGIQRSFYAPSKSYRESLHQILSGTSCTLILQRRAGEARTPVVLFYEACARSAAALEVAMRLARTDGDTLLVAIASNRPEDLAAARREIEKALSGSKLDLRLIGIDRKFSDIPAALLRITKGGVLVLCQEGRLWQQAQESLLEGSDCGLVLVK